MSRAVRAALAAGIGAMTARASLRVLDRATRDSAHWHRTNYAGRQVTLVSGPALTLATVASALVAPGEWQRRLAIAGATSVAGAVGLYDDLTGTDKTRGLRGHLGAAAHGEMTTGAVKIVGLIGAGSLGASASRRNVVDAALATGVVAASANLTNLFDLRPGRALKVGLLSGLPLLRGPADFPTAGTLGAAIALLPADLNERTMLGDAGAGALGAAVAAGFVATADRPALIRALTLLVALTLLSEAVSFTRVIASVAPLRRLDEWGRRAEPEPFTATTETSPRQ